MSYTTSRYPNAPPQAISTRTDSGRSLRHLSQRRPLGHASLQRHALPCQANRGKERSTRGPAAGVRQGPCRGTQHDDSEVFDPSSSQEEIRAWATRGDASDLLYLYCHAIPMDKFLADDSPDSSSLAFGATEQDPPRVTLRQLRKWWNEPRQSHPVVILNACASGKSDAVLGAPFVDFFTRIWSAQAFIGQIGLSRRHWHMLWDKPWSARSARSACRCERRCAMSSTRARRRTTLFL